MLLQHIFPDRMMPPFVVNHTDRTVPDPLRKMQTGCFRRNRVPFITKDEQAAEAG
jgi:hypothetical protein